MDQLESLLEKHYYGSASPDCASAVADFVVANKHPPEDILVAKNLIKVAHNVLKELPLLNGFEERLHEYAMETIARVQKCSELPEQRLRILESHLFSHAASFALALYERNCDLNWAFSCYNSRLRSAEISEGVNTREEQRHAFHSWSFVGAAAYKCYARTRKMQWARSSLAAYDKFLSLSPPKLSDSMRLVVERAKHDVHFFRLLTAHPYYNGFVADASQSLSFPEKEIREIWARGDLSVHEPGSKPRREYWKVISEYKIDSLVQEINEQRENSRSLLELMRNATLVKNDAWVMPVLFSIDSDGKIADLDYGPFIFGRYEAA